MYEGERFNAITHIFGSILALAGGSVAIALAVKRGGASKITAVAIYAAMLFLLYLSSTLYHSLRGKPKQLLPLLPVRPLRLRGLSLPAQNPWSRRHCPPRSQRQRQPRHHR